MILSYLLITGIFILCGIYLKDKYNKKCKVKQLNEEGTIYIEYDVHKNNK